MNSEVAITKLKVLTISIIVLLAGCGGGANPAPVNPAPANPAPVNPAPAISGLVPTSIAAGGSTFTLAVQGSNFVGGSVVEWNGSARPTTVFGDSVSAQISASDVAQAGTAVITVFSPAPGGGTSNAMSFTIGTDPVPAANFFDPNCAPVGAQAFTLWVNGSNFIPGSVVMWNGSARPTTVADSFNLTAQISASDIAEAGTPAVTVFNPPPGGGNSSSATFTIATGASPRSIAVDPTGKFAYVADYGCPDPFTGRVSMFTIDPSTGALSSAGTPADTGDFGATSVAVDPSGKFAYVANDGAGDTAGSVKSYAINATTGVLTPTGGNQAPCGLGLGSCSPSSVAVDPSGKFAYVTNDGGFAPTSISTYQIDPENGALAYTGLAAAGGRAVSVTVHPTGKFAYVADVSNGFPGESNNVAMYIVDATTGALTPNGTIVADVHPSSIAIEPSGNFAYVTNSGSNDISMYSINTTTGDLTSTGQIAAGTNPSCIEVDPTGKFAYVVNSESNDVSTYIIDATTGILAPTGTIDAGSSPTSIAIHPSGKFVYVTNSGSNDVSMYGIDSTTGVLTLIGTIGS
jgi:YVTN family beta-propeller protein